jgi:hypothetical protein
VVEQRKAAEHRHHHHQRGADEQDLEQGFHAVAPSSLRLR